MDTEALPTRSQWRAIETQKGQNLFCLELLLHQVNRNLAENREASSQNKQENKQNYNCDDNIKNLEFEQLNELQKQVGRSKSNRGFIYKLNDKESLKKIIKKKQNWFQKPRARNKMEAI